MKTRTRFVIRRARETWVQPGDPGDSGDSAPVGQPVPLVVGWVITCSWCGAQRRMASQRGCLMIAPQHACPNPNPGLSPSVDREPRTFATPPGYSTHAISSRVPSHARKRTPAWEVIALVLVAMVAIVALVWGLTWLTGPEGPLGPTGTWSFSGGAR